MDAPNIDLDVPPNDSKEVQQTYNSLSFAALSNLYKTENKDTSTFGYLENLCLSPLDVNHSWSDEFRETVNHSDLSNSCSPGSLSIISDKLEPGNEDDATTKKSEKIETKGKRKKGTVAKQVRRTLPYPPCYICGGKASGDHYGVNSCEACKVFFRRYLIRKKGAYECKSGGKCEIIHTKNGLCSGCRLQKCLKFDMSKERCKLGRYTAGKRTEMIRTIKEMKDEISFSDTDISVVNDPPTTFDTDYGIITRTLAGITINDRKEEAFSEDLMPVLIKLKNEMNPFGQNINVNNPDKIKQALRDYHEEFQLKRQLYGEMRTVSKEDFTKLYNTYGIDIDNRLKDSHDCLVDIDRDVYEMCNFAKHIPFFSRLSLNDQSNLLKIGYLEFIVTLTCQAYDPELKVCLDKNRGFHISEMDKIVSQEFVQEYLKNMLRCQKLQLNDSEQVLVMALSLFFTDRCFLENPCLVEKIQLSLTQMLRRHLEKYCGGMWRRRFTSIIEYLTDMRSPSELYQKEMREICRDEIYGNEFPMMSGFLPKEGKNSGYTS